MKTGKELFDLLATKEGAQYVFGIRVPKNNPTWQAPWDCAEFGSWGVYQVTGLLYGCYKNSGDPATADAYSGYWGRDAELIGKKVPVEIASAIPGAFLVRLAGNGTTGHLVCCDGHGGTIEAYSTNRGVIRNITAGRRWDFGVLPPGIDYTEQKEVKVVPPPTSIIYRWKTPMMHDDYIKKIQTAVRNLGYEPGVIDGWFGKNTYTAVRMFQLHKGLVPDGEVGPLTRAALEI